MTETESYCQNTGAFLIFLPLIATVLPLFGLQLRRLRNAGEFAPLAALVPALVGVGMICYARRNQGDAPMFGGAAAAFVLLTGIGGFFMVSALENGTGETQQRDRYANQSTQRDSDPDTKADYSANEFEDAERNTESAFENSDELREAQNEALARNRERMNSFRQRSEERRREADDLHRKAMEAHNQAMEQLQKDMDNAPNFSPPNFPTGFPAGPPAGGGFGRRP